MRTAEAAKGLPCAESSNPFCRTSKKPGPGADRPRRPERDLCLQLDSLLLSVARLGCDAAADGVTIWMRGRKGIAPGRCKRACRRESGRRQLYVLTARTLRATHCLARSYRLLLFVALRSTRESSSILPAAAVALTASRYFYRTTLSIFISLVVAGRRCRFELLAFFPRSGRGCSRP